MLKPKVRKGKNYERFYFKCDKIYFNKNFLFCFYGKDIRFCGRSRKTKFSTVNFYVISKFFLLK